MKIAVLTSSRADYGVYLPLLKALQADSFFDLHLVVFGTHLSSFHGYTVSQIENDGFVIYHKIEHILASDSTEAMASSMALAHAKFATLWAQEQKTYDLVFCLGDRYEMFAAVSAGAAFQIRFAHIHGGETTLGAIDNEFRHCISIFSTLHFTATQSYADRVAAIKGSSENIYSVGALSLDNLSSIPLLSPELFQQRFGINLSRPSLLITYHPQTISGEENKVFALELTKALANTEGFQFIITMPNADAMGNTMRTVYEAFARQNKNVCLVENFGTQGYFTCMKAAALVVGNSSSGIIEAASFGKYVINIGDRQKGRAFSENAIHCANDAESIQAAIAQGLQAGEYKGSNSYYKANVSQSIINVLKNKWKQ